MENPTSNSIYEHVNNIDEFERYISTIFTPVSPRVEFVQELHGKILSSKETGDRNIFRYSALGAAGAVSGLILVATSIQAIITLLGTIKIIRQLRFGVQ